jgi:ribosomal protein S1
MTEQVKELETQKTGKTADTMESLIKELGDNLLPFAEGDTVEATILAVGGNRIWVDVAGQSLGFIPEKEISSKSGLKAGDKTFCTVISMEDDAGNVVLSMKRADREKYWKELEEKFESGEPEVIKIIDANKGGLMTEIGGIQGFLPVSQLSPTKYPRVTGGDKEEILTRLRKFIGQEMAAKVINCDKESNKLIFSEKAVKATEVKAKIDKYKVGDKVRGKITGIVDFGLFVSLDPQIEGLVHISEVSWGRVTDLTKYFKVGDEVETMIISTDEGRISLSVKRLLPDPWAAAASKYKVGDIVKGEVTKITPFGAFVSLDEEIDGLVHISELSPDHISDPGQVVELGKEYQFKIISIEPESHRLGLSLKVEKTVAKESKNTDDKKVEEKKTKSSKKIKEENQEAPAEIVPVEEKPKAKKTTKKAKE